MSGLQHLPDPESPKVNFQTAHPGYLSEEERSKATPEKLKDHIAVWGTYDVPMQTYQMDSLSYCGEILQRIAHKPPNFLWDCINYTMACSILDYPKDEICWECVARLDEKRQLERPYVVPVIEMLKRRELYGLDACGCKDSVLFTIGCQCGGV